MEMFPFSPASRNIKVVMRKPLRKKKIVTPSPPEYGLGSRNAQP
jgi:hypothetical protein